MTWHTGLETRASLVRIPTFVDFFPKIDESYGDNQKISKRAKSFRPCQLVRTAQADMTRYYSQMY